MQKGLISRNLSFSNFPVLIFISFLTFLLHLVFSAEYGFCRDELYYMTCGERLDFGYVDLPPLIPVVADVSRGLFGSSVRAIRFFPAVAAGFQVWFAGMITRELGGGKFSEATAALLVFFTPSVLIFDNRLSNEAFAILFFEVLIYIFILIEKRKSNYLWLIFGTVAGFGILTTNSILLLVPGILFLMPFFSFRRHFLNFWFGQGAIIAALIVLPYLIWEAGNGWPTLEYFANQLYSRRPSASQAAGIANQIGEMHPAFLPFMLLGLYYYLLSAEGRIFKLFGLLFFIYLAAAALFGMDLFSTVLFYPVLLAGSAVLLERMLKSEKYHRLRTITASYIIMAGLVYLPFSLPVLNEKNILAYTRDVGNKLRVIPGYDKQNIPAHFADMFGWPEMVETIAAVFDSLPVQESISCGIYTNNYGEAGAVDFYGRQYGLPRAISSHNNYWLWGPRKFSGDILIAVGGEEKQLRKYFDEVIIVARFTHPHTRSPKKNLNIYICKKSKKRLNLLWPEMKLFI